jgi:8-oxo-dGTP pyrophosphatase MutT (NUDIX family)
LDEFIFRWESPNGPLLFSWVGQTDVVAARVYALAFVAPDKMVLVSEYAGDPHRWLPGGGVEPGETAEAALARELLEEADATIVSMQPLGAQRVIDPWSGQELRQEFHRYYWCRVQLADQIFPRAESTMRHLIAVEAFLDSLSWGRRDPKAPRLYKLALEAERRYGVNRGNQE